MPSKPPSSVPPTRTTLRCRLFGHRPAHDGWWGDIPYMDIRVGSTDGVGTIHAEAYHECKRCGLTFLAGRLHLNIGEIWSKVYEQELISAEAALRWMVEGHPHDSEAVASRKALERLQRFMRRK